MRVALIALLLGACHAKFKKHAPIIQRAHVEVTTLGPPQVVLGQADGDGIGSLAVNAMQAIRGGELAKKIARAVDTEEMDARFSEAFVEALGDGPPFAASLKGKGSLVSVEVVSWGMGVPEIGLQGTFSYSLVVRIYMPDGKRVYTNREACAIPVGDPDAFSQVLGIVDNAKAVDDMSRRAIREAFYETAAGCAAVVVSQMRKHGG